MRRAALLGAMLAVMAQAPAPGPAPTSAPTSAPTPAPLGKAALDGVLSALKVAPSEEAAAALEGQARKIWNDAATPALKLLLSRGARELSEGAAQDAVDSFDAALDLDGNLLEGWRGRAQARLHLGDMAGAVKDLQEVLRREPRSFVAWEDLSRIAEVRGDWRGALSAWQKVLELDPRTPGGRDRLRDLRRRALGEDA